MPDFIQAGCPSCQPLNSIEALEVQIASSSRHGYGSMDCFGVDGINQGGHKPGKPGVLRDLSGNSVQPEGKIVTNKMFLVCHSNISVKQLLTG